MNKPYYGMFTDEGNALVHGVVECAKIANMNWQGVEEILNKIAEIDGFREASDTAVRDEVHIALTMADFEMRVENI